MSKDLRDHPDDYIEVKITPAMVEAARDKLNAVEFDESKGLSRFGSEVGRTLEGYIGQRMAAEYIGARECDTYEYDLLIGDIRIEVKTISCKFRPPLDFLCTVNSSDLDGQRRQRADFYLFTRILFNHSLGWLLGKIRCKDFFLNGKYCKKGDVVPGVGRLQKANATVLPISMLAPIKRRAE